MVIRAQRMHALARSLMIALAWCVVPAAWGQGAAAGYPSKPVRLVVGFPPGGPVDILSRVLAKSLGDHLGQTVVIDNRAGANGIVGTDFVAKSTPDGYTLLMGASTMAIQATLVPKLPFDTVRDLTPIAGVALAPLVLTLNKDIPVNNVKELVEYLRARPGQVAYASPSSGSANHLAAEMLKITTGTTALHVPYKGGAPAEVDLIGGRVAFMFHAIPAALPHVRAGRLKALAVTADKRSSAAPDIPTFAESGLPGFDVSTWYGVLGPAGLPPDVVARVNDAVNKSLDSPEVKARLVALGSEPMGGPPERFRDFIGTEIVKWAKVIKASGATAD